MKRLITLLYDRVIKYALKFGVVGLIAYFIDVAIFNLLRVGVLGTAGWWHTAIGASVISIAVSTLFTWIANRYWTFREHRRKNYLLELFEFLVVAGVGAGINLGVLWITHYGLGWTSLLADNISKNLVGLGLATVFRFLLYRFWVYGAHRKDGLTAVASRQAEAAAMAIYEDSASATRDAELLETGAIPVVKEAERTRR